MLLLEALGKHDSCITWGRAAQWLTSFEPYAAAQFICSCLSIANAEKMSQSKTLITLLLLLATISPLRSEELGSPGTKMSKQH